MEFRTLFGEEPGKLASENDYAKLDIRLEHKLIRQLDGSIETSQLAMHADVLPTHCPELALAKHREANSTKLVGLHLRASGFNICDSAEFRQWHFPYLHDFFVFQWSVRRSRPAKTDDAAVQSALKEALKCQGEKVNSKHRHWSSDQ